MRLLMRPALLLWLVAVIALPALADKAKSMYLKGEDAEARQNYEAAYDFFKQAYDLKPKDLRYRTSFERIRFKAAASVVARALRAVVASPVTWVVVRAARLVVPTPSSAVAVRP